MFQFESTDRGMRRQIGYHLLRGSDYDREIPEFADSVPENCQLTSSFVVVGGAQTVVILLQTTHITSDVCFNTDYVACQLK